MSQRISFSIVIALLVGWGVMSLLIFRSSDYLVKADTLDADRPISQPRGVKIKIEVDKKVFGQADPILISVRNDSRKDVWLAEQADGCAGDWWLVDVLEGGENWVPVVLDKSTCPVLRYGQSAFEKHTIRTGEWNGLIAAEQIGNVFDRAPTGTYRLRIPYVVGPETPEEDWAGTAKFATSPSFTLQ